MSNYHYPEPEPINWADRFNLIVCAVVIVLVITGVIA